MLVKKNEEHDNIATRLLSHVRDYGADQPNVTGEFPIGNEYSLSGLSFDPGREARSASYEEYLEKRKKAEAEEEKRRKSRRDTDFAVSIALLGAMGG